MFFDRVPNILNNTLLMVNCGDCLSAEFIGRTSVPCNKTGKHFDFINENRTSSDALRPIFPKMLLKVFILPREHLNFMKISK